MAQERLRSLVQELEAFREDLMRLRESIPASTLEESEIDFDEDPDVGTEIRTVIQCVVTDCIGPAITDLRSLSSYRPDLRGEDLVAITEGGAHGEA